MTYGNVLVLGHGTAASSRLPRSSRNQTTELPYYLDLALDHGVKPREISEVITHGWPNAFSALPVAKEVWHGETATTSMTHIAIQEFLDGTKVEWMERISDEQYRR